MFFTRILYHKQIKNVVPVIQRYLTTRPVNYSVLVTQTLPFAHYWIWKKNYEIKSPPPFNIKVFDLPNGISWVPPPLVEPVTKNEIVVPSTNTDVPKEAARLIVIRRKKMKKHKLKKLRKRMKYEWAKLRQKREFKKEKSFQAELIQKCKEAETFSAEKYVEEKLNKLHEIVIPRYWKGKRLPEFLMRQKMGLPPK